NPASFPELISADGKGWYFNSSAAEQCFMFMGMFHSMVREMHPLKFNFFLDEVIIRRNRSTVEKLKQAGCCPAYSPCEE
ncbi:hypothetical protein JAAARDRAFT_144158, partial [Jaapia argillacea MUCL 33604]